MFNFLVSTCCLVEVVMEGDAVIFLFSTGCLPSNPTLAARPLRAMETGTNSALAVQTEVTPSYNPAGLLRNCSFQSRLGKSNVCVNSEPCPKQLRGGSPPCPAIGQADQVREGRDWPSTAHSSTWSCRHLCHRHATQLITRA